MRSVGSMDTGILGNDSYLWIIIAILLIDAGMQCIHLSNQTSVVALDASAINRINTVYMTIYFWVVLPVHSFPVCLGSITGGQVWFGRESLLPWLPCLLIVSNPKLHKEGYKNKQKESSPIFFQSEYFCTFTSVRVTQASKAMQATAI